jgi:hypothetical protein
MPVFQANRSSYLSGEASFGEGKVSDTLIHVARTELPCVTRHGFFCDGRPGQANFVQPAG